jgi:hypothetical protein
MNLLHYQQNESYQRSSPEQKYTEQKHFRTSFGARLLVRHLLARHVLWRVWRSVSPSGAFTGYEFIVISFNDLYLEIEDGNF